MIRLLHVNLEGALKGYSLQPKIFWIDLKTIKCFQNIIVTFQHLAKSSMPKLQKEKTKKVIRYWRSGNIYPPNITDQLDKIIDSAINGGDGGVNNDQVF